MPKKKAKKAKRKAAWLARDSVRGNAYIVSEVELSDVGSGRGRDWWCEDQGNEVFCPKKFRRLVNLERPLKPGAKPRRVEIIIREPKERGDVMAEIPPVEARTHDQLASRRRTIKIVRGFCLDVHAHHVLIEVAYGGDSVSVPRQAWDELLAWYMGVKTLREAR